MAEIHDLIPNPVELLALDPEELAGYVLEILNSKASGKEGSFNRGNFSSSSRLQLYPQQQQEKIGRALMEAWMWLERENLIAPKPGDTRGWYFVTRRGTKIKNHLDLNALKKARLLPKEQLHPAISTKVWPPFLRGDYESAIFQAFREVEISVRRVGNYGNKDIGVKLMRKAFHSTKGNLTDPNQEDAEKEATSNLFSGAIGLFKNPSSHREVELEPEQAVELIMFASFLLRKVDERAAD